MQLQLLVAVVVGLGSVASTLACSDVAPIAIPWKPNPTEKRGNSRGIPLNAGDNQDLALRISTFFSVTRVHSGALCEDAATDAGLKSCDGRFGSTLDVTAAEYNSSFEEQPNTTMDPNDALIQSELADYMDVGHIPLIVNGAKKAVSLGEYPFVVMEGLPNRTEIETKSGVGMGRWSTFLDRLYQLNLVPSKVWGFTIGLDTNVNSIGGELTIGGDNPRYIAGTYQNFTITDVEKASRNDNRAEIECPLRVLVSDMTLSLENGTHNLFPDGNFSMVACIDPFQQSTTMPETVMAELLRLTGAFYPDPIYNESPKPLFLKSRDPKIQNFTLTIKNGDEDYVVFIPGEAVAHDVFSELPSGRGGFSDTDYLQLEFRNKSDNYPLEQWQLPSMILGGVFLSQQYLLVDYSRNMFSLAPAAIPAVSSNGDGVRTICDLEEMVAAEPVNEDAPKVIALSVVAGVGWLGFIAFFCSFMALYKSRKRQSQQSADVGPIRSDSIGGTTGVYDRGSVSGLSTKKRQDSYYETHVKVVQ